MVKLNRKIMTRNDCYKAGVRTKKKGVMVHLTATPGVMAKGWFSRWNKPGIAKCVHYFVDDKEIYQYLDEDYRSWHGGKNVANSDYISIEGCEPAGHSYSGSKLLNYDVKKNTPYFNNLWDNYTDLVADICRRHGFTEKDVIGHIEGGRKGIASASSDPDNLFRPHGKTMDDFRTDVGKKLRGKGKPSTPAKPTTPNTSNKSTYQGNSIVEYLNSIKVDSSMANRKKLAAKHGISNYKGTAKQNLKLLAILRNSKPKANNIAVDGYWGAETTRALQKALGTVEDGIISRPSLVIKALQKKVGTKQDGYLGPDTIRGLQKYLGTVQDGKLSRPSMVVKEMQRRLNAGTF